MGRPEQVDACVLKAGVSRGGLGRGAGHGSAMRSGRRPEVGSGESMGLTEEGGVVGGWRLFVNPRGVINNEWRRCK